jgi:hypothetical protein
MWPHASLAALAEELARLYTPEVARLQDDIEAIAAATRRGGTDPVAANVSRLKCIARTLRHDGHQVEQHPFDAADRKLPSRTYRGTNLLVRDPHAPRPTHAATPRLMLVAHGDMTGRGSGSEGAYDNASGVAVLMHVMRQVHADRVPCAGACPAAKRLQATSIWARVPCTCRNRRSAPSRPPRSPISRARLATPGSNATGPILRWC